MFMIMINKITKEIIIKEVNNGKDQIKQYFSGFFHNHFNIIK